MFDEGKIAYWLFNKWGITAYVVLMLCLMVLAPVLERKNLNSGIDIEALASPLPCQLNCEATSK